jgi:tetratricopeptide (TPR) repeat protein
LKSQRSPGGSPKSAGDEPFDPRKALLEGLKLHQSGKLLEAEQSYRYVLARNPSHFDALHLLGVCCYEQGKLEEASSLIGRALKMRPRSPEAHSNLGLVLRARGSHEDALARFDRALSIKPDYLEALSNRGDSLKALDRFSDALASYDRALAINPGHAAVLNKRGSTLVALNRHEEAVECLEKALAILPRFPEALSDLGNALKGLGRCEEALECYEKALTIRPEYAEVLNNRGNALHSMNRNNEAIASFDKALAIRPDYAEAHVNQSLVRRVLGDFERGWSQYEWRWKRNQPAEVRNFGKPLWLGNEELSGKTILLHAEQGFGDTIQFCRYASLLADRGANVVLEVQPGLKTLLASLRGVRFLITRGELSPPYDFHCPLLSLPLALNTQVDTIPRVVPYLSVPTELSAVWKERLGSKSAPRVGIVWSGSSIHKNDRNRSLAIRDFVPRISNGCQLVSLQKEVRSEDQELLANQNEILHFGGELEDFSDTAALISQMDLVISVDTSVAHLAGAVGKPVWILLPFCADWRWLLERSDSPWYPTARLFRQPAPEDWNSVVRRVAQELSHAFSLVGSRDDHSPV